MRPAAIEQNRRVPIIEERRHVAATVRVRGRLKFGCLLPIGMGGMSRFELNPIGGSIWLVFAVAGVMAGLAIWGLSRLRISDSRRRRIGLIRLALIALLAMLMLQPSCTTVKRTRQSAVFVVLADVSRSMQLPQAAEGESRFEAQRAALHSARRQLADLAEEMEVVVLAYHSGADRLPLEAGNVELPANPAGAQTDIGGALDAALQAARGKRLAGILLLGDGAQTAFEPRVEIQPAADELRRQDAPLFAVAFGPEGETTAARDVAIESLPDQLSVFVKNELTIKGSLRVRGFVNQQIPVELALEDQDGREQIIGAQEVAVADDGATVDVVFRYAPEKPGTFKLTMRAPARPGELVVRNNELTAFLTVLEGGLRVLYVEGELRAEALFLRRSLAASQDIELDFQWIDHRRRDTWPVDITPLLKNGRYDVFILGDLDATALFATGAHEENLELLTAAIADGKGLLTLGGYHSFGPGGWRNTPLRNVLPIVMGEFERQDFDAPPVADLHHPGPLAVVPTEAHFLTLLGPGEDLREQWLSLPALDGANKLLNVKDRARVLATTESGAPLLVTGEFGRGRVAVFAGDSTWRWRMQGREDAHKRFWRQMALWLARRDDQIKNNVWVSLPQRRFAPGAGAATFTAGARSPGGDPISGVAMRAVVERPDGEKQTAALTAAGGDFAGAVSGLSQPGVYKIRVFASKGGQTLGESEAQFEVFDHDVELANPAARHDQLAQLASVTSDSGGRFIQGSEIGDVLEETKVKPLGLEVQSPQKRFLGKMWFDAWLMLVALVGLLAGEWALRRKWALA